MQSDTCLLFNLFVAKIVIIVVNYNALRDDFVSVESGEE